MWLHTRCTILCISFSLFQFTVKLESNLSRELCHVKYIFPDGLISPTWFFRTINEKEKIASKHTIKPMQKIIFIKTFIFLFILQYTVNWKTIWFMILISYMFFFSYKLISPAFTRILVQNENHWINKNPYILLTCGPTQSRSIITWLNIVMTSSNGNIFRVTGHLCGKFTGPRWISRTKASDVELWCFLWSASE